MSWSRDKAKYIINSSFPIASYPITLKGGKPGATSVYNNDHEKYGAQQAFKVWDVLIVFSDASKHLFMRV